MMSVVEFIIQEMKHLGSENNRLGMQRFGINTDKALGVSMPVIRDRAKAYKKDHALALSLWETGIHELRIMAGLIDDPRQVTPQQMDAWAKDFNSWDLCDQVCLNLFDRTPFAETKIREWALREEEFVRRAAFATLAGQAVHMKKAPDEYFITFFPQIEQASSDPRNFVKKAVNWALRQIGKRNPLLNAAAQQLAEKLLSSGNKTAGWIARDALKELSARAK
jgi:3-methyladenine DNA glycosylase AlkD